VNDWLNQLRRVVGVEGTTDDALLYEFLGRATAQIRAYTRRELYGTTQGTVLINYHDAQRVLSGQRLYLPKDLYALGSVINGDGQVIPVGSVWTEPRNEGPPYRMLMLKTTYVWTWNTDADVQIVGGWGYGTVAPQDVEEATFELAAHMYRAKDTGVTETAGYEPAGEVQYAQGMPQSVRWKLAPYRSRTGGAV
jgi:hypothetical protein